jgi:hypothetical protein
MVLTTQSLPREGTGDTPVLRGKGRRMKRTTMRREKGKEGIGRQEETAENGPSPKRVVEKERKGAVREEGGAVRLISTFPSVSRGISCYMDGTMPVGIRPRGVAGPVVVDSHAHSRILRCRGLEYPWSLDSSESFSLFF